MKSRTKKIRSVTGIVASILCAAAVVEVRAQQGAAGGEWRSYGGDKAFTRYSPLDQINRET